LGSTPAPDIGELALLTKVSRRIAVAAVAAAVVASLASISSVPADATEKGTEGAGAKAVAHYAGAKIIPGNHRGPSPRLHRVGMGAGEPTIGATNEGNVYFVALPGSSSKVLKSADQGDTWTDISPTLPSGQNIHKVSLDPYIYVDEAEGVDRIFTIDLTVACSYMSFSDDEGETWLTNPLACGRPVNDHQTLFSGPPKSSITIDYPNALYYCWNDVASSSCSKSIDGGLTFRPTGFPAYPGVNSEGGFCGGLHGHGHVDVHGNVYLPREYCGKPYVAISRDEGTTWENILVAPKAGEGSDPSVTTDRKGNIYYTYIGVDRLPYLVISKDAGKSWTKPMMIGAPGVKEANLPSIDASSGTPGKIAIAYYGSDNSPYQGCKPDCEDKMWDKTTWDGHMTISVNALDKDPIFYSTTVNAKSDPFKRKHCGPGRCDTNVYDFIDVQIAPDGQVWGAFVDGCILSCPTPDGLQDSGNDGVVGHLVGFPPLL
jgi:hypothetical protein